MIYSLATRLRRGRSETGTDPVSVASSFAPGPGESLVTLGVAALARSFALGDASPRHACDLYLDRIARYDGAVGAFVAVDAERARRDAAASSRRRSCREARSVIDGVPVAIKSNIAVRGLPWTAGIGAWRHRIASEDAACVARLRSAGAVILGTVNMDAGALGARTDNPWFGRTHNPCDLARSAGGSSGGPAAAVAAGLCAAALGTDTMGSVRIPAAACGVFAVVPPVDAIDRTGIVPLAPSFDRVGILARSLADLRCVLRAFVDVPSVLPNEGLPLAMLPGGGRLAIDDSVRASHAALHARMTAAGWRLVPADLQDYDADRIAHELLLCVEVEGASVYRDLLVNDPEGLGTTLCSLLRHGAGLSVERRDDAARSVAAAAEMVRSRLIGHAGLASPTVPHGAREFDEKPVKNTACFTAMASITGLPAIALPWMDGGVPQSLQLIAPTLEATLRLAGRIQPCIDAIKVRGTSSRIASRSPG